MEHEHIPSSLQDAVAVVLTKHREVGFPQLGAILSEAGVPPRDAVRVLDRIEDRLASGT
jgi:hypothetical protein